MISKKILKKIFFILKISLQSLIPINPNNFFPLTAVVLYNVHGNIFSPKISFQIKLTSKILYKILYLFTLLTL